jgi:hypothetical protein
MSNNKKTMKTCNMIVSREFKALADDLIEKAETMRISDGADYQRARVYQNIADTINERVKRLDERLY